MDVGEQARTFIVVRTGIEERGSIVRVLKRIYIGVERILTLRGWVISDMLLASMLPIFHILLIGILEAERDRGLIISFIRVGEAVDINLVSKVEVIWMEIRV